MASDDMVFAEINGTLKYQSKKSFIFSDADGDEIIVAFSQIGTITHATSGDMTVDQLKALRITRQVQQIASVEIPRWLADKLHLGHED